MRINTQVICNMPTGTPAYGFRLTNSTGAVVELTNWGARWLSAIVPDKHGEMANVLVRPTDLLSDGFYMGAIVGRFANRIGDARFCINGQIYQLEKNDGQNTNHGGFSGFDRMLWDWEILDDGVRFKRLSPDGEGGYPGNVHVTVEYRWTDDNELSIRYYGTTDKATFLNLTNHAYFNLGGKKERITGHILHIPSHTMLDTTPQFIPTGKRVNVDGTPFDFTSAKPIGQDLYDDHEQLKWNKGYNHCYILKTEKSPDMVEAAWLSNPTTGRSLTVKTDLPSVLLYTAGYYVYPDTAVCLETQYYPDTPSHPDFPSCLLRPGEEYRQTTVFRFDTE
ncbi:aldose epimerase family protein [Paraprevotella xylaniphila]